MPAIATSVEPIAIWHRIAISHQPFCSVLRSNRFATLRVRIAFETMADVPQAHSHTRQNQLMSEDANSKSSVDSDTDVAAKVSLSPVRPEALHFLTQIGGVTLIGSMPGRSVSVCATSSASAILVSVHHRRISTQRPNALAEPVAHRFGFHRQYWPL